MNTDFFVDVARDAIMTLLLVSAPVMISSFVIGLLFSFLQAIFPIHEQTFAFIPKLLVIFLSVIIYGSWMLQVMSSFARNFFTGFERFVS